MRFKTYFFFFYLLMTIISLSQNENSKKNETSDLRYSVYGLPKPAIWEFQLSYINEKSDNVSTFNFYKKNQRNKTIFFKIADNNLNNRNELKVKEATGGLVLFPVNDDDRYQLDIGGTYDVIKDTNLKSYSFFSRATIRPQTNLWFRYGFEYFEGFTIGSKNTFKKTILNSNYFAGKIMIDKFSLLGVIGNGKTDNTINTRFGFGGLFEGPMNTFILGGYIKSNISKENVSTIAIGRSAPFYFDGLPSAFFIWKHKENYDFQLGGIFWTGNNLFVKPAAIGMCQGMFISSLALRENSELRQGKLMSITDDYRNSDITFFYVYINQGVEMIPGNLNYISVRVVQLYKIFSAINFSIISKPVVGLFFNFETEPEYLPSTKKFIDKKTDYFSFQIGITLFENFILNSIYSPKKNEGTIAVSYIYK